MAGGETSVTRARLHVAASLDDLVAPLADEIWTSPGDVLSPLWCVVPTTAVRSWLDQALAKHDADRSGGVTANIQSILPKDLAVTIERLALGDDWVDFGTESTALRLLGGLGLERYDEALSLAEAIDEVVRWRPHLLEAEHRGELPAKLAEAMRALDLFDHGAHVQRARVIEAVVAGRVAGLPSRLSIFGLGEVAGGRRFLELLSALATQVELSAYVPVPDPAAADRLVGQSAAGLLGWSRDSAESLELWGSIEPELIVHEAGEREEPGPALSRLQARLRGGEAVVGPADDSVTFLGCFGDGRQAEQLRDAIFESIAAGVAPEEILVVSPDPAAFSGALERHWNYQRAEDDGGPRLAHELTKLRPKELSNRLGASLSLLRMVGNYASVEQVADLLALPSVASTLGMDLDAREQLVARAQEGKLIFGISAEQRRRFGVYEGDAGSIDPDVGTWERVVDSVVASSLYPPAASDFAVGGEDGLGLSPLGEPIDLEAFAALLPLLRVLEEADELRAAPRIDRPAPLKPLAAWLDLLEGWMAELAQVGDSGDDSFERSLRRLRDAVGSVAGLDELELRFEQFLELWDSQASARSYSRLHGRRGVVVCGLDDLAWARYRVVAILGLDDDRMPDAGLPSPVMALLPPGSGGRRPAGDPDLRRHSQGALLAAVLSAAERLIITADVSSEESGAEVEPAIVLSDLLDRIGEVTGTTAKAILDEQRRAVRRHGFFDDHQRARFDARLRRIDDDRPGRAPSERPPAQPQITLAELHRFFRNPVGQHLIHARNVLFPRSLEGVVSRPATSVDSLTRFRFRERYVTEASALGGVRASLAGIVDAETWDAAFGEIAEQTAPLYRALLADTELAGDVPAIFWAGAELKEQLDLFVINRHFDELDHEVIISPDSESYLPIDLGDLGELLLLAPNAARGQRFEVRRQLALGAPTTLRFHPSSGSKARPIGQVASGLLELLALRVNHPSEPCRAMTFYLPASASPTGSKLRLNSVPTGRRSLNPYFELKATPEQLPAEQALDQLRALVSLYRRGMEEVPALFRRTSELQAFDGFAEAINEDAAGQWSSSYDAGGSPGEEMALSSRLLFPHSFKDLCRKTDFERWALDLREAGPGVRFHFGSGIERPVPVSLMLRHEDFRAQMADRQTKALEEALEEGKDEAVERVFGRGRPLLLGEREVLAR